LLVREVRVGIELKRFQQCGNRIVRAPRIHIDAAEEVADMR
jgi:hypothetical protein